MFVKEKVESINLLNQISEGMKFYGGLKIIKENIETFRPVFTPTDLFQWTYEGLYKILKPDYRGEVGSNRREGEINTYRSFLNFMEESFNHGKNI